MELGRGLAAINNFSSLLIGTESIPCQLSLTDEMRRPVSDGMLYAPKLSTCSKHKR